MPRRAMRVCRAVRESWRMRHPASRLDPSGPGWKNLVDAGPGFSYSIIELIRKTKFNLHTNTDKSRQLPSRPTARPFRS